MKRFQYIAGVVVTLPCLAAALLCDLVGLVFEGASGWSMKIVGPFRRAVERTWTSDGFMVIVGSQIVCWAGCSWERASVVGPAGPDVSRRFVFCAATLATGRLVDLSVWDEGSMWFYITSPPAPWASPEVGTHVVAQNIKSELKIVCRDRDDSCLASFEAEPAARVRLLREDELTGRWFRVVNPLKEAST